MALFKKKLIVIKKTTIKEEVEKIINDDNTASVEYNNTAITIITKDIKTYGKFFIMIYLRRSSPSEAIKIECCNMSKEYNQHFHIGKDSEPCFGNICSDVEKGLSYKRYYLVYNYIIALLNSYEKEEYYNDRSEYKYFLKKSKKNMRTVRINKNDNEKSKNK